MRKFLVCFVCIFAVLCDVGNSYGMLLNYDLFKRMQEGEQLVSAEEQAKMEENMELAIIWFDGLAAEKEGNYVKAAELYRQAAEGGQVNAQNNLGLLYEDGKGVKKDLAEAVKWYRKAADNGECNAMFNLGSMYMNGEGVKHDKYEAFKWYMKAAENGNINAYYNVGHMYYNGYGVNKDYVKAAEYYRKAADRGISNAQISLGVMYFVGEGVSKNYDEAYRLWKMAEDQGDTRASKFIQSYWEVKDSLRRKAEAEAQLKAAREAKRRKKTSGSNGDFVQGLQGVNDVLSLISDIANIFSGRMTTVSSPSAQPSRVTSSRTGKTYTARKTPRGNCPHCFGSGECPRCASTILRGSENHCRECGGSKKCQWCQGYGTD